MKQNNFILPSKCHKVIFIYFKNDIKELCSTPTVQNYCEDWNGQACCFQQTSCCTCYFLTFSLHVLVTRRGNGSFQLTVSAHTYSPNMVGRFFQNKRHSTALIDQQLPVHCISTIHNPPPRVHSAALLFQKGLVISCPLLVFMHWQLLCHCGQQHYGSQLLVGLSLNWAFDTLSVLHRYFFVIPDSKLNTTPDFGLSIERHFKRAVSHPVRSWCQAEILIIHPLSNPERVWAFWFIFLANQKPSSQFLSSIIPKPINGSILFCPSFFSACVYLMK